MATTLKKGPSKLAQSFGETKPGLFTTEFILTVLVQLGVFCSAIGDVLPAKWAAAASAVSAGAYALSRGWAKSQVPVAPIIVEKEIPTMLNTTMTATTEKL